MSKFFGDPSMLDRVLGEVDYLSLHTPHVAGVTNETVQRRGQAGAENVDRVARDLPALHLITDVESMAP